MHRGEDGSTCDRAKHLCKEVADGLPPAAVPRDQEREGHRAVDVPAAEMPNRVCEHGDCQAEGHRDLQNPCGSRRVGHAHRGAAADNHKEGHGDVLRHNSLHAEPVHRGGLHLRCRLLLRLRRLRRYVDLALVVGEQVVLKLRRGLQLWHCVSLQGRKMHAVAGQLWVCARLEQGERVERCRRIVTSQSQPCYWQEDAQAGRERHPTKPGWGRQGRV
mmetsp:Transcript_34161/g.97663  ORF Transcript_34161/g.97663 Transcript_34161/m.97663 type:complete len:217 (-) Transcript_34161:31-681(-)